MDLGIFSFMMLLSFSVLTISAVVANSIPFQAPEVLDAFLAAHPVSLVSRNQTNSTKNGLFQKVITNSQLGFNRCPVSCADAGTNSNSWTVYHDLNRLSLCNLSMMVDFALYNPLDDPDTHVTLRTCASAASISPAKESCASLGNSTSVNSTLQLGWSGSNDSESTTTSGISAVQEVQSYLQAENSCDEKIAFAYSGNTVVGFYAGAGIVSQNITEPFIQQFLSYIQDKNIPSTLAAQSCASGGQAEYAIGIMLNTNSDWASVQGAVQTWRNASCITTFDETTSWQTINYLISPPVSGNMTSNSTILNNIFSSRSIEKRDIPQPYSNGTCFTYTVVTGDLCSTLAATYGVSATDIASYNNDTWGWMGCSDLQIGSYICLSSGYPPMPVNVPNAVCGPQMNGTATVPHGTDLSTINECPLNACCDIWGQCGTTAEFCTISNSSTGAPGTAAVGQNGCISNCGTDIVVAPEPPGEFFKIGYFEGYDWQRPCLAGSIASVNTSAYTHIHLAFAILNADFSINVTSLGANFDLFVSMTDVKKIISFGGWEFSTSSGTYDIFREAVQSANRQTFINNVIGFLFDYGLDGVDFDWEYPGETDIPGIPASSAEDASNFYAFLLELNIARSTGPQKSVSMTAPASFWYLQNLEIEAIAQAVDYIVFMTYDLHGQWDYGAAYSDPGCPAGNCLRSDVNLTETINALSMITKAGVPSTQVVVGVTSYGRAFQMTDPGCYTEMCTYTGPDSGATPGSCTNTSGYLGNGEISDIISRNSSGMLQYVDDSFSNILIYNDDQWVSYMDDDNKATRTLLYQAFNMAGTVDWAVDLQNNGTADYLDQTGDGDGSGVVYVDPSIWTDPTPVVNCIPPCSLVMPPLTLPTTTTVSFPSTSIMVTVSTLTSITTTWGTTTTIMPSYLPLSFPTVVPVPPYVGSTIAVWGISISSGVTSTTLTMSSSIQPSLIPLVVTPVWGGTTIVNGGTVTTDPGTTYSSGTYTYIDLPATRTFGGSTTVSGGITGTPVTTTITPNPHPTTSATTPDQQLNSRTTTYSSATPTKTCTSGCGKPCVFFCDPGCLFCPPHVGDSSDGSGNNDDDGDGDNGDGDENQSKTLTSESSTATSSDQTTFTVPVPAVFTPEPMPTPVDSAVLAAVYTELAPIWSSLYPPSTTTTSTTSSAAPSSTSAPDPSDTRTFAIFYDEDAEEAIAYDVPYNDGLLASYICTAPTVAGPVSADLHEQPPLGTFDLNGGGYQDCSYTYDDLPGYLSCSGGLQWDCQAQYTDGDHFECGDDELILWVYCPYTI